MLNSTEIISMLIFSGLPYFKWLKKENRKRGRSHTGRSEFARLQREVIENYLVGLVRAVVCIELALSLAYLLIVYRCSIPLQTGCPSSSKYLLSSFTLPSQAATKPRQAYCLLKVSMGLKVLLHEKVLIGGRNRDLNGAL